MLISCPKINTKGKERKGFLKNFLKDFLLYCLTRGAVYGKAKTFVTC
jgi:hypothetical protein